MAIDYTNELTRQQSIREELLDGETIEWTGQPTLSLILDNADIFLIPFSLIWGGFWIFLVIRALIGNGHGSPESVFTVLWGIPFFLVSQYLIWGRYFYKTWKKKRTYYAVTNKRVLIVIQSMREKSLHAAYIKDIRAINKSVGKDGIGTIEFGNSNGMAGQMENYGLGCWAHQYVPAPPAFYDIHDANIVYELVNRLRNEPETKY